jgi:hypothetical protein
MGKKLTKKMKEKYLNDELCPFCGGDEIQMFGPSRQGVLEGKAQSVCRCLNGCCRKTWIENYVLESIQDMNEI